MEILACKEQGGKKAMCWIGLVGCRVLGPLWVEGIMDVEVYKEMLEDFVWPAVWGIATRIKLWFMQDVATCHTTTKTGCLTQPFQRLT